MADAETRQFEAQAYRADEAQAAYDEAAERFEAFFGSETVIDVITRRTAALLRDPEIVRHTYFGTDHVDGEASDSFDTRSGRCYEMAALALVAQRTPAGSILVHGTIHNEFHSKHGRIGHAWLMLPGGLVWEPTFGNIYRQEVWREWANPTIERTYRRHVVLRMLNSTRHYGPWSASEYKASRS